MIDSTIATHDNKRENDTASQGVETEGKLGVANGIRTHDNRNHNPGLYR